MEKNGFRDDSTKAFEMMKNLFSHDPALMRAFFTYLDTNESQEISFEEFLKCTDLLKKKLDMDQIRCLFNRLDHNKDGHISLKEFHLHFDPDYKDTLPKSEYSSNFEKVLSPFLLRFLQTATKLYHIPTKLYEDIENHYEILQQTLKSFDDHNDGKVSLEKFKKALLDSNVKASRKEMESILRTNGLLDEKSNVS